MRYEASCLRKTIRTTSNLRLKRWGRTILQTMSWWSKMGRRRWIISTVAASSRCVKQAIRRSFFSTLSSPRWTGLRCCDRFDRMTVCGRFPLSFWSSREETDLVKSYSLGVNAYVVKPVDFKEFFDAVKRLGVFWALVNEPPLGSVKTRK